LLDETLQHCGAVVSVYSSADAVMADLPEFLPTVFISDLSMPGLDGLQFMRRMRQVSPERGGQVPAIAITAYYEDYAAAEALEVRHVPGAVHGLHARSGDSPRELVGVDRRHQAVLLAPHEQRRRRDAVGALLQSLVGNRPDELAGGAHRPHEAHARLRLRAAE